MEFTREESKQIYKHDGDMDVELNHKIVRMENWEEGIGDMSLCDRRINMLGKGKYTSQ